jgi:molecular chaperone GrpE
MTSDDIAVGAAEAADVSLHDVCAAQHVHDAAQPEVQAMDVRVLSDEIERLQASLLRLQADFDNFRRRTRIERDDQMKYALLPLVEAVLPIVDNFARAIAVPPVHPEAEAWHKGIAMNCAQLEHVLAAHGVHKMTSIGTPFDPAVHEAIGHVPADETLAPGTVAIELQPGYRMHDRVIRPALVHVAQSVE